MVAPAASGSIFSSEHSAGILNLRLRPGLGSACCLSRRPHRLAAGRGGLPDTGRHFHDPAARAPCRRLASAAGHSSPTSRYQGAWAGGSDFFRRRRVTNWCVNILAMPSAHIGNALFHHAGHLDGARRSCRGLTTRPPFQRGSFTALRQHGRGLKPFSKLALKQTITRLAVNKFAADGRFTLATIGENHRRKIMSRNHRRRVPGRSMGQPVSTFGP